MNEQLQMVLEFHEKFHANPGYSPRLIDTERAVFRHQLIRDEVDEYLSDGVEHESLPDIAKELCDILHTVYGTIIEHGLQDIIEDVFAEVHRSNMSKDYSPQKMLKGDSYSPANVEQFFKK
jgi:predicted HAD superfamily Cof-like phosphohydrolase